MESKNSRAVPVQSVRKAMDLLNILAFEDLAREGVTLTELARRLGQPANTTHNLLKSLAACGYAAQNQAGRYVVGPRCEAMGRWNRLAGEESGRMLQAAVARISAALNEGVVFVTLVDGGWVSVARAESQQGVQVAPLAMSPDNIYTLATGRVLTAFASPAEQERIVERHGLPRRRWGNLASQKALADACSAIREQGVCILGADGEGDIVMVACPAVAEPSGPTAEAGSLIGALGCYVPAYRCPRERLDEIVATLKAEAHQLGQHLS